MGCKDKAMGNNDRRRFLSDDSSADDYIGVLMVIFRDYGKR